MYKLNENNSFEINNYQEQSPFSSFLPGIAGVDGIPMWVFYVNRGQGIASFGVQDKNHAMMEFLPADKSYQHVSNQGFRTFVKIKEADGHTHFTEPFSPMTSAQAHVQEKMTISENLLELEYVDSNLQLKLNVTYFTLPNAAVGGLVRQVSLTNLSDQERDIELIDGLPSLFPSGVPNAAYKELGNTIKSWFDVKNLENDIPFYQLRGSIEDTSEVKEIHQGNFYASFYRDSKKNERLVKPIIDRDIIFGTDTSLHVPRAFMKNSLHTLVEQPQQTTNKVSAGFSWASDTLAKQETLEFHTVIGYAKNVEYVQTYVKETLNIAALEKMKEQAKTITKPITSKISTKTAQPLFDAYAQQSFLDNGLRGGFPTVFGDGDEKKVYYLFSRKHGDLERDYNFFSISPTYYSQGNGNYRDVNQNRRCDILFEPKVEDYNIKQFMNLVQLDGYNPLVVKGVRYELPTSFTLSTFVKDEASLEKLGSYFQSSYTPGELKHFVEEQSITLSTPFEEFLTTVLVQSEEMQQAEFGEGYWMDHWTYNLDLIDSYLAIYPDKEKEFFFNKGYKYFESPVRVKNRKEKYVTKNGKVRQYNAVEKIKEKQEKAKKNDGVLWIKDQYGEGNTYYTSLYSKLVTLALVKTSTLAPFGLGVEMEGDKPGWNDSLNGLPGMIGSSTSELFELKRLLDILRNVQLSGSETIALPKEVDMFLRQVVEHIAGLEGTEESEYRYWNNVTTAREEYRETIYKGLSGEEVTYTADEIATFLHMLITRVEKGIQKVEEFKNPLVPTYFYFELDSQGENVEVYEKLKPNPVTPFLEGVVKQLKLTKDKASANAIYNEVKQSNIYDKKLKMYKTSMSIANEPLELGRAKSFTPGWLENESIFLHMEYKYLLATLKSGLADEFFEDMKHALIPFLDPKVYGRSPLENSSFIASSANPNEELHGRGFVSRLSGSTIEFMNMWFMMMAGEKPFRTEEGQLVCELSPTLPDWMFDDEGEVTFTFLGQTEVTYVNKKKANTYGENGVSPTSIELTNIDGTTEKFNTSNIVGEAAGAVRRGEVKKIVIELA